MIVLWLGACLPHVDVDTDAGDGLVDGAQVVLTTLADDYSVGALSTVDLDDWAVADGLVPTSGDAVVRVDDGRIYQLDRFNYDTVRVFEPGSWEPRVEFEVGDLANPHDVDVCGGKLFVSLHGRDHLAVYDERGWLAGTVDLSAFADGDDVGPEPSGLVERDGQLFVALHRKDRSDGWANAGGRVVQVDCAAEEVVDSWAIGANTSVHDGEGGVFVTGGAWDGDAGGLWWLDGDVERLVETDVGIDAVVGGPEQALVIGHDADDVYGVYCFDGELELVEATGSYLVAAAATATGQAWISARSHWSDTESEAGLLVYDIASCTRIGDDWVRTELDPYSLAILEEP